jgi:O-antigen/teichoic acid export membrane protein
MFILYATGLLCNFNTETATGVLQITNQVKLRGTVNLIQALFSAAVIGCAFIWLGESTARGGIALLAVLCAYLLGKAILGIGLFIVAWRNATEVLGTGWVSADVRTLPSARQLLGFAASSNLSGTAILVFRESEVLWVGLLLNNEAAGLYKVAFNIVGLLSIPADPLILSVYPEANRLVVQKSWQKLRGFLRTITSAAFAYNAVLAISFAALGQWLLSVFGHQYVVAYPALLALLVGMVFNYTLFWNRPLLLSFGLQQFALGAIVVAGFLKVLLAIPLVPRFGYVMEAVLLSAYYVISVGLISWRGLRTLNRNMLESAPAAP